jgi:hypothetical protein
LTRAHLSPVFARYHEKKKRKKRRRKEKKEKDLFINALLCLNYDNNKPNAVVKAKMNSLRFATLGLDNCLTAYAVIGLCLFVN